MNEILQKTENVANNVANENSQDLTEQWKKGELNRNKIYYYETPFNTTDTASGFWLCNHLDTEKDKVQILEEVPSYEELQNMNEAVNQAMSANIKLVEQNAQLKERVSKLEKMHYSYTPEEWNTMLRTVNRTSEQNAQLKELLKWCRDELFEVYSNEIPHHEDAPIIKKLDEVLK